MDYISAIYVVIFIGCVGYLIIDFFALGIRFKALFLASSGWVVGSICGFLYIVLLDSFSRASVGSSISPKIPQIFHQQFEILSRIGEFQFTLITSFVGLIIGLVVDRYRKNRENLTRRLT